jgi:aminomethyltransferase
MSELQTIYESAFESALIVQHDSPGVLELHGADRLDLLHRLSTNDLENMPAEHVQRTVFTDPVGRMIDVVTVLNLSDELLIVTSSGRLLALQDWLQRHIFFQDDVTVHLAEKEWSLYGVYGPEAADSLPSAAPDADALMVSDQGIVWSVDRPVPGFLNLLGLDHTDADWAVDSSSADAFEILRVEAGLPKMGAEIREDSIPLEVGLWDEVSFVKGCYVGQEIIARMESRGKLAKQLVGIRLESQTRAGSILKQDGKIIGTLTSVVESPRLGWIGLASGRPSALETEDGRVEVDETGQSAFIVELPFTGLETPAPV